MPYKDKQKQKAYVATWQREHYIKTPPKMITVDMKKYKKTWREANAPIRECQLCNSEFKVINGQRKYCAICGKKSQSEIFKTIVFNHYGNRCNCCGETNKSFFTIDHVNNDGNKDKDSKGRKNTGTRVYMRIFREGFPDSYQILCMNCNWSKYLNKGICEHKLY